MYIIRRTIVRSYLDLLSIELHHLIIKTFKNYSQTGQTTMYFKHMFYDDYCDTSRLGISRVFFYLVRNFTVWSPKTNAKRNLMNNLVWRKNTSNLHAVFRYLGIYFNNLEKKLSLESHCIINQSKNGIWIFAP